MEKVVKASQEYKCDVCGEVIDKGECYVYDCFRVKEYTPYDFDQPPYAIGWKYIQTHYHLYDCSTSIECQEGKHVYKECSPNFWDLIPGNYEWRCEGCGELRPDVYDLQEIDIKSIDEKGYSNNG